jgi:hypothetical protein
MLHHVNKRAERRRQRQFDDCAPVRNSHRLHQTEIEQADAGFRVDHALERLPYCDLQRNIVWTVNAHEAATPFHCAGAAGA